MRVRVHVTHGLGQRVWRSGFVAGAALCLAAMALGCRGAGEKDEGVPVGRAITDLVRKVLPRPPRFWLDVLRESSNPDERRLAYQHLSDPELYKSDPELQARMVKVFALALDAEAEGAIVRATVAQALGRFPMPASQKALERAMRDSSPLVRGEAARAMGAIRQPGGSQSLGTAVLADTHADVRAAAALALARFPTRSSTESLVAALADSDVAVATRARKSLAALTGQNFGEEQAAWRAFLRAHADRFPEGLAESLAIHARETQHRPSRKWFLLF